MQRFKRSYGKKERLGFELIKDGILKFKNRWCVPKIESLRKLILAEAHRSRYTIHPGSSKMYKDLKQSFWWNGMKKAVAEYVAKCLTCQQIKAEH